MFTWKKGHEAGLAEDLAHFLKLFELCQPYDSSSLRSAPHYFLEPQRVQYDESEASEVIYPNLLDGGSLRVLRAVQATKMSAPQSKIFMWITLNS